MFFKKTAILMVHIITMSFKILLVIVASIGIIRYKKLDRAFKILVISVVVSLFDAMLSNYLAVKYKNNLLMAHIGVVYDYVFFSVAYYYLFKSKIIKTWIFVSIIILALFAIVNGLFLEPFNKVAPINIRIPAQILYALFSLLMFRQMLSYPVKVSIVKQSVFWYNTAMLFFATTLFLIFIISKYLSIHHVVDYTVFYFWYGILYIFYVLIGISILLDNREVIAATDHESANILV
jgi:hypothetical protein